MIRSLAAVLALTLAATACTQNEAAPPPGQSKAPDTCGAAALQGLVGRPKTEIPVATTPGNRRVSCTTCPVTMDYRPERLNIVFDEETGIVKTVKCG